MASTAVSTPAPSPDGAAGAWSRHRDNVARHLIGISRDLQSRVIRRLVEERGYGGLRPSLGAFLSLIWTEGRRLNAIADQLAISRQACSQLANLAERAGYLERKPDPADGRSKVVMLSARGRALVEHAVQIIVECEAEYAELVGAAACRRFAGSLAALFDGFGIQTPALPELSATASRSVGVLPLIAVRVQQELMQATIARGHPGLKLSHGQVLALIGPEGARVREIARIQRVTRQAISAISQDLEALGYLRREPDARDRRGVVLRLTDRGTRLVRDCVSALDELESSFRDILGERRFDQLQRVSRDLYRALELGDEIAEAAGEPHTAPGVEAGRARPRAATDGHDIRSLATILRRQLGSRDTARLAALLEERAKKTAT
jgi:DNA-binding MarR family transcriptional regulator